MDRHGGLADGRTGCPAAVMDAAEVFQLGNTETSSHVDFVIVFRRKQNHSIDLFRSESGILDGCVAALDGETKGAAARLFRELGCADADKGGLARKGRRQLNGSLTG